MNEHGLGSEFDDIFMYVFNFPTLHLTHEHLLTT